MMSAMLAVVVASQFVFDVTAGQSLSQGGNASTEAAQNAPLSTTQPYSNTAPLAFSVKDDPGSGLPQTQSAFCAWPTTPLLESTFTVTSGHYGESPRSAYANYYRSLSGVDLHMISGSRGGTAASSMLSGSLPFIWMERQMEAAGVRGGQLGAIHFKGHENDDVAATTRAQITANLVTMRNSINAKANAVTRARGNNAVMFITQNSNWTKTVPRAAAKAALAEYDAARADPSGIKLTGPSYQYAYDTAGLHMTAASYRAMGATAGKARFYNTAWQPLWPRLSSPVSRNGAVITVYLYTPTPPLVVDTTTVTGVSASTRGFEYTCGSSPPAISSVDCSAACSGNVCSCDITLASTPGAPCLADDTIGYAITGTSGNNAGPTSGARGNIRDSDTATWQGANLHNWLVHLEESVP